ncbi:HAD family hydrolase [Roseobacter sp. HKCCA0434]|uniref:HAD family hydrolase n=1 Tax=Roseobacter sp. HKCCA0434 TaxID=3079297 RepID=UPI002905A55C|nr:HAD family hydrolase [Roseobacter sp. HKCCA0434]
MTDLSKATFVLATDLDGTFLGGSDDQRRDLYDWIEARRSDVGLVFVSGRDPEFIHDLCSDGFVPWPDFVIGDVGTTVARVDSDGAARKLQVLPDLEADIASRWQDSGARVRAALDGVPGLTLQPTPFRYRVSYDLDAGRFDPAAKETVDGLGLDWLISDDRFFDVLPRGVSKGPTLLRFLDAFGVSRDRVLVAGDTLNDLSMFQTGLNGAVVGGSEQPLLDATADIDTARHCTAIGAAGIMEAIAAFDLHPDAKGDTT